MIRPATPADRELVVDILAEAFTDDPVFNWVCDRPGYGRATFEAMFPLFIPHGVCHLHEPGLGATLWLPPGQPLESPLSLSVILNALRFGLRANVRSLQALRTTMGNHPPAPPHYYLFAIGTRARLRGRGIGSGLLQEVTHQCDRQRIPAYLENSKHANLEFFRSHGFEVRRQVRIAPGSPPLWLMWRTPRQA